MPIWKVEPVDPNDNCWKGFSYRKAVVVRAGDEAGARSVAAVKLGPKWHQPPVSYHGLSPWHDSSLSSCHQIESAGYEEDGDDELLEPLGQVKISKSHRAFAIRNCGNI